MEALMLRTPSCALAPADEYARAAVQKIKTGAAVRVNLTRVRNPRFHRKMFALFKLAFDAWEPTAALEYKGQPVEKDFDRFRKDLTILAGFYRPVYNARGEVRLEPESISFGSMSEERFEEVYKAVLNVVWKRVLKSRGYASEADIDRVVNELLEFES